MNLQIELSTICNWNCIYCPRPFLDREMSYMSLDVFSKALDMFLEKTTTLILSKDGEPLTYPKFDEIFKIITERYRGKLDLYTNGVFLDTNKIDILGNTPNEINIFVTEHVLGRDGVQDSTKTLTNFKNAVEKNYPNLKFYLTKHSFYGEDIEDLPWITIWNNYKNEHKNIAAVHLNKHKNSWLGFIGVEKYKYCPFMEYEFTGIGVTGNVLMCCSDLNEELVVGNIIIDTKQAILTNWKKYRTKITNKDVSNINPCNRCLEEIL